MNMLKASFTTWAVDREGELKGDIAQLFEEIEALNRELTSIIIKLIALGVGAAIGLPALGALAFLGGPISALVGVIYDLFHLNWICTVY